MLHVWGASQSHLLMLPSTDISEAMSPVYYVFKTNSSIHQHQQNAAEACLAGGGLQIAGCHEDCVGGNICQIASIETKLRYGLGSTSDPSKMLSLKPKLPHETSDLIVLLHRDTQ